MRLSAALVEMAGAAASCPVVEPPQAVATTARTSAKRKELLMTGASGHCYRCEVGGEGGIRTPGPLSRSTVFKTAALNHSATSPGESILPRGPRGRRDALEAAHERAQGIGNHHRPVRLLEVFQNRDQGAANGETRAV